MKKCKANPNVTLPKKEETKKDVPESVKIAWKDLKPSIKSVFKKTKWKTKFNMFKIFEMWVEKQFEVK